MKVNSCAEKAMKISAKARYALSIVLDVAANAKEGVQGAFAILDCLKPGVKCPEECTCFARKIWGEINDSFVKTLSRHTVASMLKDKAAGLVKLGC